MPGMFSPPPRVSAPDMHHGTCVTHVPWFMPGSLTSSSLWSRSLGKREVGGGENVPGIPGACATQNFTYLVRGLCIPDWRGCTGDDGVGGHLVPVLVWDYKAYSALVCMIYFMIYRVFLFNPDMTNQSTFCAELSDPKFELILQLHQSGVNTSNFYTFDTVRSVCLRIVNWIQRNSSNIERYIINAVWMSHNDPLLTQMYLVSGWSTIDNFLDFL